ncbi:MIP/aquaporin family protein [Paenarthrobacter sp. NPDC057355]|uniref:MIP/aquaporin family protein n=1 Tax=Paenarthrobacter sp. NPDC057355 TaxID=3346105 RepID=UPI0036333943
MTSSVQATAEPQPGLLARLGAEALGSLFIVLVAVATLIFSDRSGQPLPSALATGLTVTVAMLAFGYVSSGHFNPVITLGSLIAGRIRAAAALAYVVAQIIGSVVGAALVFIVVTTVPVITDPRAAFGSVVAGYGEHAAAQTQLAGVLLVEVVGSALLVAVFLGATAGRRALPSLAPFAVGLSVAVLLQFSQVLGNLPFNPARATAQAFFGPSWALDGLWLFWVAPLMGAALTGLAFRGFQGLSAGSDAAAEPQSRSDAINDEFDAGTSEEALDSGTEAAPQPLPVKPAHDDARDFFDNKKG